MFAGSSKTSRPCVSARLRSVLLPVMGALFSCLSTAGISAAQTVQHIPGTTSLTGSANLTVTLHPTAGTVTEVRVLTQGIASKDFTDAGGGTCVAGPAQPSCTVNVLFKPTTPGHRPGAVVLVNGSQVVAQQLIDGVGTGSLAVIHPGKAELVAGNGQQPEYTSGEDGGVATYAHVYLPRGVIGTPAGDFYISDTLNNRIRHVSTAGNIYTYAGIGYASSENDGAAAKTAGVNLPAQLAMDGAGNLYFADTGNNAIRRVDAVTHIITTVAGTLATSGSSPDNTPATSGLLLSPYGVALDADGNIYIADTGNNMVRRVDASTGMMTIVAGTGIAGYANDGQLATMAQLNQPFGLAFDPSGALYIADKFNQAIRKLGSDGKLVTVAGVLNGPPRLYGDGGPSLSASLNFPTAVAVDALGNIYIADSQNNRIRRANVTTGNMESIVSYNRPIDATTLVNADTVELSTPYSIALDDQNNLYITDDFNKRILLIHSNKSMLYFDSMKVGKKAAVPQILQIENDGTDTLTPSNILFNQSALDAATTTCYTSTAVTVGRTCALGVQFAPTTITDVNNVNPVGTLTVQSDGSNSPDVVSMTGIVLSVEPTKVTLSSNKNPAGLGDQVTFTAVVSETQASGVPTGTVTFYDGTTAISGDVTMNSNGIATFSTSSLSLGSHTINATYGGDNNNASSTDSVTQNVLQNTSIAVVSSSYTAAVNQPVTFTATISATTPVTSGTVTFYDGSTAIGAGSVGANSKATFTISTLTGGTHNITAKFAGDTNNNTSTSAAIQQVITKADPTISAGANPTTITVGQSTMLTATVASPNGPAPTGTITFANGVTVLGSGPIDGNGTFSLATTGLTTGTDTVTATYSGDDYTAGGRANTVVTVNQLTTVTTLASDGTPSDGGSAVTLTATVTMTPGQTAVGAITGNVTFYDGANALRTTQLTNGVATLSTTVLTVGTHSLTAKFNGSTNYEVSTSPVFTQVVQSTSSSVALQLSTNNVLAGKSVTMTATVSAVGVVKPTGQITFMDGATTLNTVSINGQGTAAITLSTLAVGQHSITATYSGDGNYAGFTSAPSTVMVSLGTPTLTLGSSTMHTTYNTPVTLNVNLISDGVLPSNPQVKLLNNSAVLNTMTVNGSGSASFTTQTLTVGTHTITAQFAGDQNNSAAQAIVTIIIDGATSNTVLTTSNASAGYADTVTLRAAVASGVSNPTGTVTFQDGANVLGVVSVDPTGVAAYNTNTLSVGQHNIVAVYSGDGTHASSNSNTVTQSVFVQTHASITSSANPAVGGSALTLMAGVSASVTVNGLTAHPTGTVTFLDGASTIGTGTLNADGTATLTLSSLSVGTHSLTSVYRGDGTFQGSTSAVLTQGIRNASTQTVLTTSGSSSHYGNAVTFTANVTGESVTPTGNVRFMDGSAALGQVTLNHGTATLALTTLSPGMHSITASYAGDSNNSPSVSSAVSEQVTQIPQIALVSSINPALTLDTPVLTATIKTAVAPVPTGSIRFLEGTTLLGTGALDANGTATITAAAFAAGSHVITAQYAGDVATDAATSPALTEVVNLRATQTLLTSTAASTATNGVQSLVAVVKGTGLVSPTGIVTFYSGGKSIGSGRLDATGVATLSVQNTVVDGASLTAGYSGDANYAASNSSQVQLPPTNATNFTLSLTPATLSVQSKKYAETYLVIQSLGGFSDTLSLGCLGLPYAATCTFEKVSVGLPADGQVKVKVVIDTGSPLTSGGESASSSAPMGKGPLLAMLPVGPLFVWLLRGKRRVPALLMLVLLTMLIPVTGCGTLNQSSTPVGSYTFSVSASSKSGVTLSLPVSLTVTQ
ncbi:Ig-like domain repeat protein [Terriglobus roseus]|uniref:NHL repeat-containing protein n=1 Tax=Terriglobus roseus TaxID=392734 RepID=A0A1G7Q4B3_9BACT|nr:Ig-like domain repeat protein [Terriglobus roseus]SDF93305.1 NHL repeat-containing protein [Terriglobus roseus]